MTFKTGWFASVLTVLIGNSDVSPQPHENLIRPKAAKLTEIDIYRITGYASYGSQGSRDGCIFNNMASVEEIHQSLEKPIPENVDPQAIVDLSEYLPRLWSAMEVATEYELNIDDVELRIEAAIAVPPEGADGLTDSGEALYYLAHLLHLGI